jgi:hypothetical protein
MKYFRLKIKQSISFKQHIKTQHFIGKEIIKLSLKFYETIDYQLTKKTKTIP